MSLAEAKLRHRELTQAVYDIGDEVAEYIEHCSQAMADYDVELVADCLYELDDIAAEAVRDIRLVVGELMGLRRAMVSGLRSGSFTWNEELPPVPVKKPSPWTAALLEHEYPLKAADTNTTLLARAAALHLSLARLVDWVLYETTCGAIDVESTNLQLVYGAIPQFVDQHVRVWAAKVVGEDPAFAASQKGHKPPEFLAERARVHKVLSQVSKMKNLAVPVAGAVEAPHPVGSRRELMITQVARINPVYLRQYAQNRAKGS